MRVALVGPTYPYRGGIAHYTTMLHRALKERGHDASLISFRRLYPSWLFPGQSDKDPSQEPLKADKAYYWIDSLNPVSWVLTAVRLRRRNPDLVVLSWWTTFLFPAWLVIVVLARACSSVPVVFICHNVLPHEARFWDRWIGRLVLGRGTGYIVQSDAEGSRLKALLPHASPVVVPHPVYDMFKADMPPKSVARERLHLPVDQPVLLFFGIVREYKGLMDLLDAMPDIRCKFDTVRLVIAGEFWEPRKRYEQRIRELGIDRNVVIDDRYIPNEEVPLYFSAADLVVAPHRRATGSGVAQMAIGFGVPLLATFDGLVKSEGCPDGLLVVPPGDPPAIADAVASFLSRGRIVDTAGMQALRSRFSWAALADACVGLARG